MKAVRLSRQALASRNWLAKRQPIMSSRLSTMPSGASQANSQRGGKNDKSKSKNKPPRIAGSSSKSQRAASWSLELISHRGRPCTVNLN